MRTTILIALLTLTAAPATVSAQGRAFYSTGLPDLLTKRVREYQGTGRDIDVVAMTSDRKWLIVAKDWRYYSHKSFFDQIGLRPKIEQYLAQGRRIRAVAITPQNDWVVVGDGVRYYSSRSKFDRMGLRPELEKHLAAKRRNP